MTSAFIRHTYSSVHVYLQISDKNTDENAFGDSILDDQLGDMEIKIYTQAAPPTIPCESNYTCAVVLDADSEDFVSNVNDEAVSNVKRTDNYLVCYNDKQTNLGLNTLGAS